MRSARRREDAHRNALAAAEAAERGVIAPCRARQKDAPRHGRHAVLRGDADGNFIQPCGHRNTHGLTGWRVVAIHLQERSAVLHGRGERDAFRGRGHGGGEVGHGVGKDRSEHCAGESEGCQDSIGIPRNGDVVVRRGESVFGQDAGLNDIDAGAQIIRGEGASGLASESRRRSGLGRTPGNETAVVLHRAAVGAGSPCGGESGETGGHIIAAAGGTGGGQRAIAAQGGLPGRIQRGHACRAAGVETIEAPGMNGAIVPQDHGVAPACGDGHDRPRVEGWQRRLAPGHERAVAFQCETMSVSGGDGDDVAEARGHRVLAKVSGAPHGHGAVLAQGHGFESTGGDGDHAAETSGHIGLSFGIPAPGNDRAIAPQCDRVLPARGDGNDICQARRHIALAFNIDAPCGHGAIRLDGEHEAVAAGETAAGFQRLRGTIVEANALRAARIARQRMEKKRRERSIRQRVVQHRGIKGR